MLTIQIIGVSDEVVMHGNRKDNGGPDRLVVGMAESFSFVITVDSALVWCEHKVAIDDDADRKTGPDGDRRLDVEIAAHDLLACLVETVGAAAPERSDNGAIIVGCAKLRADAEDRREGGRHTQPRPMMIDVILEAGEALAVGAGLP